MSTKAYLPLFTKWDEIDDWLYDNFRIIPGSASSIESVKYRIARDVAEKLWTKQSKEKKEMTRPNTNCEGCLYWKGKCKLPKGLDCPERKEEKNERMDIYKSMAS